VIIYLFINIDSIGVKVRVGLEKLFYKNKFSIFCVSEKNEFFCQKKEDGAVALNRKIQFVEKLSFFGEKRQYK